MDANLAVTQSVILENSNQTSSHFRLIVPEATKACPFLAINTGLSKLRIKDAMIKGAVWLKRYRQKEKRIRKATFELLPNDAISLYYNPDILAVVPPSPRLIAEEKHYSVWFKPANLLTQGTRYGDHCSLLRLVKLYFKKKKETFLIHRLDREASGLVLVAHSRQGAAAFSELFRRGEVEKRYRAKIQGRFALLKKKVELSQMLDGKEAVTIISGVSFSPDQEASTLDILLQTGRFHQIRRHLSLAGYPIIGDPKYGNAKRPIDPPLQLFAYALQFKCPFTGKMRSFILEEPDLQV